MSFLFDRPKFFTAYKLAYPSKLNQSQVDGLNTLLGFIEADPNLKHISWPAYMLATVKHETDNQFVPNWERGPKSYFDKYEPGTRLGIILGNTVKGDGYRRRGRGYVHTTGLANDKKLTKALKLTDEDNLIEHPEAGVKPEIAYWSMSYGMRTGLFTGRKLSHYLPDPRGEYDYLNARRIINGLDKAELIASYARQFESILAVSLQEQDKC